MDNNLCPFYKLEIFLSALFSLGILKLPSNCPGKEGVKKSICLKFGESNGI